MQPEDLILVSVDDHLIEPPDVFLRHVPANIWTRPPGWSTRMVLTPGSSATCGPVWSD